MSQIRKNNVLWSFFTFKDDMKFGLISGAYIILKNSIFRGPLFFPFKICRHLLLSMNNNYMLNHSKCIFSYCRKSVLIFTTIVAKNWILNYLIHFNIYFCLLPMTFTLDSHQEFIYLHPQQMQIIFVIH